MKETQRPKFVRYPSNASGRPCACFLYIDHDESCVLLFCSCRKVVSRFPLNNIMGECYRQTFGTKVPVKMRLTVQIDRTVRVSEHPFGTHCKKIGCSVDHLQLEKNISVGIESRCAKKYRRIPRRWVSYFHMH